MNENPETDASNTEEQELSEGLLDEIGGGMNGLDTNMGLLSNRLTSLTRDGVPREDVVLLKKYPPEFKRVMVTVARRGDLSAAG